APAPAAAPATSPTTATTSSSAPPAAMASEAMAGYPADQVHCLRPMKPSDMDQAEALCAIVESELIFSSEEDIK
ncbi:unnamed protein product, partial [Symbiodinium pilosum]